LAEPSGFDVLAHYSDHIISRQRPPDPLQLELTHGLDVHGVLDLCQHPRLGLIAKPRGDVGYGADGGVVEAALEADGAESGKGNAQFSIIVA
jgi:hypothetical protein